MYCLDHTCLKIRRTSENQILSDSLSKLIHYETKQKENPSLSDAIITAIQIETGVKINADNTIIIFDEIQGAKGAITSLKYFCENAPQYHRVSAGFGSTATPGSDLKTYNPEVEGSSPSLAASIINRIAPGDKGLIYLV